MEKHQDGSSPHVLIFPLQVQGHIKPMLNLAELFCMANFKVTFLVTTQNHRLLTQHTNIESRFENYPRFEFTAIPDDGRPERQLKPNEGVKKWLLDVTQGLALRAKPVLREILTGGSLLAKDVTLAHVTCMVVDGWLPFAYDIASEFEIPVISFRCPSASCIWAYFCTPNLIETGELPFQDEDMDELVRNVPGMNTFVRYRDLPSFCRNQDESSCQALRKLYTVEKQRNQQARGLILNTCEDLEGPILSHLRSNCATIYAIGPLHTHLRHRLGQSEQGTLLNKTSSSSLWEADISCISWLDKKPDKSVVYVSFGSLTVLKREQLLEIWAGLVQSNKYFLWVIRPNLIYGSSDQDSPTPVEILEATNERGCIVSWCVQEEVLAHRAVGGFMTHSGWNSTLESIVAGVPMLCWPYFADQQLNSRFVSEVWKIGLDMKDTCDQRIVAKMINDLMDCKKDELRRSVGEISQLVTRSVSEGGSSYCEFDRLLQDIRDISTVKGAP